MGVLIAESTLEQLIETRAIFPAEILRRNGLLPDELGGSQQILLSEIKKGWDGIGDWLRYFLLNNPVPDIDHNIFYKPAAEKDRALLTLLQELYLKVEWVQDIFSSPGIWWNGIFFERLSHTFKTNGLLGPNILPGKRADSDRLLRDLKEMEDFKKLPFQMWSQRLPKGEYAYFPINGKEFLTPLENLEQPIALLTELAIADASDCIHFRNGTLRDFLKTQKRCTRLIRNNPELRYLGIADDGSLWVGGKGKGKRQKKRKRLDTS